MTTYGRELRLIQKMDGTAEIITKDRRLIMRFLETKDRRLIMRFLDPIVALFSSGL